MINMNSCLICSCVQPHAYFENSSTVRLSRKFLFNKVTIMDPTLTCEIAGSSSPVFLRHPVY